MNNPLYLAHRSADGQRTQTVRDHLLGTAARAAEFGMAFGCEEQARWAALLHDVGKYSAAFQRRLAGSSERVDHSTAGAQLAWSERQLPAAFAVAGHHSGLPDGGSQFDTDMASTMYGRIKRKTEPCEEWQSEILLPAPPPLPAQMKESGFTQAFYTRMLYSCLVDADYLDTEAFMVGAEPPRGIHSDWDELVRRLNAYIAPWLIPGSPLNERRCSILRACMEQGNHGQRGLYELTVPTGGGKTVASLGFALSLAKAQKMDRIVYVIPYTSIIEQNAAVFSDILGRENVLEHHSGADYTVSENASPEEYRKALATENWDMPVVVTTSVQFFESLFANRSSRCRKLHNLANSVIIFDEAQNLPLPYLRPCVAAIAQLVQHYRAAAVLCTATQPALRELFAEFSPGLPIRELCPEPERQFLAFRRTTLRFIGEQEFSALSDALANLPQGLCIVNRRKTAQELFKTLPADGSYCLTTLLCAAHRKRLLREIRERLAAGLPCRVVSTSLIEAGVDVDFPVVYRELAGLDSLLQAAGRCNREGHCSAAKSPVFIFRLAGQKTPAIIAQNVSAAEHILQRYPDPSVPQAIRDYFRYLRLLKGSDALDCKGILKGFNADMEGRVFPFATAAERFRLIESPAATVYLPWGEGEDLVGQLHNGVRTRELFRRLGGYGVPVYPDHLQKLRGAGAVQALDRDLWILTDLRFYQETTGLTMDVETGAAWFI